MQHRPLEMPLVEREITSQLSYRMLLLLCLFLCIVHVFRGMIFL